MTLGSLRIHRQVARAGLLRNVERFANVAPPSKETKTPRCVLGANTSPSTRDDDVLGIVRIQQNLRDALGVGESRVLPGAATVKRNDTDRSPE